MGDRGDEVVADRTLVLEELCGHHRADRVAAPIFGTGPAGAVSEEAREGIEAAGLEGPAEDVALHPSSIVRIRDGRVACAGVVPDTIRPPRPLLSARAEARLGPRHREVLDALEERFLAHGFSDVTMRELASQLRCSLRTLYEIAPSKRQLVHVVVDRFLQRMGRRAAAAVTAEATALARVRAYLDVGREVRRWTAAFAEDAAEDVDLLRILDRHLVYSQSVLERLIAEGVEAGEMRPVDPGVAAAVFTGAARFLARPPAGLDVAHDWFDDLIDIVYFGIVDPASRDRKGRS